MKALSPSQIGRTREPNTRRDDYVVWQSNRKRKSAKQMKMEAKIKRLELEDTELMAEIEKDIVEVNKRVL